MGNANLTMPSLAYGNTLVSADIASGVILGADCTTPLKTKSQLSKIGSVTATDEKFVFVAPTVCTITAAYFVNDATIATNDTNYWTVQLTNLTQANNLAATAQNTKTTGGTAITANTVWDLAVDQNLTMAANDVLEMVFTKSSSATSLSEVVSVVYYTVA